MCVYLYIQEVFAAASIFLKVDSSEVRNIQYLTQAIAFVYHIFASCKMIQYTFTHGTDLMRIDIFIGYR